MRFMREDEALKTMRLIEGGTETSGISKCALKNWVVSMQLCQILLRKSTSFLDWISRNSSQKCTQW